MNKFVHVSHGSLLKELDYLKQLQTAKKRLEREVKSEFRVNSEAIESGVLSGNKRFRVHKRRVFHDSDTSGNSSPRRSSLFSGIDLELHNLVYEENKLHIKNERKKLHKHLTNNVEEYNNETTEIEIGDSALITPKKQKGNHHVTYADDMLPNRKEVSPKPVKKLIQKNLVNSVVFEKKFKILVEKSLHTISDIRSILEKGIDPPDGDEDISRRLLRVKEFSNRFSRNYLYPIARQLEDLGKWKTVTSTNQKLLSAYQVILNGLQAYHNHLPTSISGCSSDKLKCLLKQLLELCEIHLRLVKDNEDDKCSHIINAYKLNAELALQKVEDSLATQSTESMLKSTTTKVSLTQKKNLRAKSKTNIAERFSMYAKTSAFRTDVIWKKTAENLNQKKNVQSRYRTAVFRHRPPMEKMSKLTLPMKCKLFPKKSSIFNKTPVTTPVNEDDIETMVETQTKEIRRSKGVDENRNELDTNHEELLVKLLQLVLKNKRHNTDGQGHETSTNTATIDEINNVLEKLKNIFGRDAVHKIIEGLSGNKEKEDGGKLELKVFDDHVSSAEDIVLKKKEPKITITGPRNAKLICIQDDRSLIDEKEVDQKSSACQQEECLPVKSVTSQTQTLMTTENKSTQRPPTKILRKKVTKSPKVVEMLPKQYAVNIIQYKLDFHKFCKTNPMYRKTTNILPWMLTTKISDELIDLVLLRVAREIEVNDIADRIYQSELQL